MTPEQLRTGLAKHLGIDRERVCGEHYASGQVWTILDADTAMRLDARYWLDHNTPAVSLHDVSWPSSDTACHICARPLQVRTTTRKDRIERRTKCPEFLCKNGKRWLSTFTPLRPGKPRKPQGFTGPDTKGRQEAISKEAVQRVVEQQAAAFMPQNIPGQFVEKIGQKWLSVIARNAGTDNRDVKLVSVDAGDAVTIGVAKGTFDARDVHGINPYHAPPHDDGRPLTIGDATEEDHIQNGTGIEVDALRVGQRWRDHANTVTGTVKLIRNELRLVGDCGYVDIHYDLGHVCRDRWRCIYDPPQDKPEPTSSNLRMCPECGFPMTVRLVQSQSDGRENGMRYVCQHCARLGSRVGAKPEKPSADPWSTYRDADSIAGVEVVYRGKTKGLAGIHGIVEWHEKMGGSDEIYMAVNSGGRFYALRHGNDTHGDGSGYTMSDWRPIKPARVEAGQRWIVSVPGGRIINTVDLVSGARAFDYARLLIDECVNMLENDDWEWLPEGGE